LSAMAGMVMAYFLMDYRGVGSGFLRAKETPQAVPAAD